MQLLPFNCLDTIHIQQTMCGFSKKSLILLLVRNAPVADTKQSIFLDGLNQVYNLM